MDPKHNEACTVQAYVQRMGPNQAGSEGGRVGPKTKPARKKQKLRCTRLCTKDGNHSGRKRRGRVAPKAKESTGWLRRKRKCPIACPQLRSFIDCESPIACWKVKRFRTALDLHRFRIPNSLPVMQRFRRALRLQIPNSLPKLKISQIAKPQ